MVVVVVVVYLGLAGYNTYSKMETQWDQQSRSIISSHYDFPPWLS